MSFRGPKALAIRGLCALTSIFLLATPYAAQASRASLGYEQIMSGNNKGNELSLEAAYATLDKNEYSLAFGKMFRAYESANAPTVTLEDQLFQIGAVHHLNQLRILSARAFHSPEANFLPKLGAEAVVEDYSFKDRALSLGVRVSGYESSTVTMISAGHQSFAFGSWSLLQRAYFVIGRKSPVSGVLGARYAFEKARASLAASGGESLEDENLVDRFVAVDAAVSYFIWPTVELKLTGAKRWGDVRSENRLGLVTEWAF